MTKQIISFTLLLLTGIFSLQAADSKPIRIGTNDIDLILKIGDNGLTSANVCKAKPISPF